MTCQAHYSGEKHFVSVEEYAYDRSLQFFKKLFYRCKVYVQLITNGVLLEEVSTQSFILKSEAW